MIDRLAITQKIIQVIGEETGNAYIFEQLLRLRLDLLLVKQLLTPFTIFAFASFMSMAYCEVTIPDCAN